MALAAALSAGLGAASLAQDGPPAGGAKPAQERTQGEKPAEPGTKAEAPRPDAAEAKDTGQEVERLYREGTEARRAGRFDQAIERLRRAVELQPDNADAQVQLGLALSVRRRFGEARAAFRKALDRAPGYDDARTGLARIEFFGGNLDAAERELKTVLDRAPGNRDARELAGQVAKARAAAKADAARKRSQAEDARREEARTAEAERERERAAVREAAEAKAREERAAEARRTAEAARREAQAQRRRLGRARAARLAGRFAEAESLYRAALARFPRDADLQVSLGLVIAFQGRYDEARAAFERALALAPGSVDARLGLARVDLFSGNLDAAEARAAAVLAEAPLSPDARSLAARIRLARGDAAGAEAAFRELVAENPADADARVGLGDALRAAYRDREALEVYGQAASIAPDNADVASRLKLKPRPRFRLDVDGSFSRLTQGLDPWQEGAIRLSYILDARTTIGFGAEASRRFGRVDVLLDARLDRRWSDAFASYLRLGFTPAADFRPEFLAEAGGTLRLSNRTGMVGATFATLDLRYARYGTGEVKTASPGIEQRFFDDRLWLSAKAIGTIAETGERLGGYQVRADLVLTERLRVFAGYADAPDSSDGRTIPTKSVFGGLVLDLDDATSVRVSAAREDRTRSYDRTVVSVGLSTRF